MSHDVNLGMKKNKIISVLFLIFGLALISTRAVPDYYEFILSTGVKIKLETRFGEEIDALFENNGGLYVCDFESIAIEFPEALQGQIDSGLQSAAMFLHQLTTELFLVQQPYEVFVSGNNDAHAGNSHGGVVATAAHAPKCMFQCGVQLRSTNKCKKRHYLECHFEDYKKINSKCSAGFPCPFCKVPWIIDSLAELGNHIRYHHPGKGYLDFLP